MMATAADRKRWDKLHADYAAASEAERAYRSQLERHYGPFQTSWLKKGERNRLERFTARSAKIGDAIIDLLVRISPRGERWLSGVPSWWLYEKLTWEDAICPADEPLSVVVPGSYGNPDGTVREVGTTGARMHRGFTIVPDDGTQLGYRLPGPGGGRPGKGRKVRVFYIYSPEDPERPIKTADSMKHAIEYIDNYLGEEPFVSERRSPALRLWKFGRITGLWRAERTVTPETADQWLDKFQRDEPDETFVVSKNKPSRAPAGIKENRMPRRNMRATSGLEIQIPDMPMWTQIGGDNDPAAYGGTFAKNDGDALEILKIQPVREYVGDSEAADVGFPFWTREAYYDLADLDPDRDQVRQALGSIDMDRTTLREDFTPTQRALVIAEALIDYGSGVDEGPSGWSKDIYADQEVKPNVGAVTTFGELLADEDNEFRRDVLGEGDEDEDESDDDDDDGGEDEDDDDYEDD